jgi:4,5-dihydroxyphthalate decarboxylase
VPVALSKIFRHSCIYVRTGAGINRPEDLRGKRVGTSQWGSTGLVFMRGMLQHDFGLEARDMHWFMGGLNSFVEPPLIPLNLREDIRLDFLSGRQTLEQMFEAGELDALLSLYIPKLFLEGRPNIARLFPNYKEVEQDYYRRTRIFPIMHTVVLREELWRQCPWIATSLYKAFQDAKKLAYQRLNDLSPYKLSMVWFRGPMQEQKEILGEDPWCDGLERNRKTVETLVQYLYEQEMIGKKPAVEELFASNILA